MVHAQSPTPAGPSPRVVTLRQRDAADEAYDRLQGDDAAATYLAERRRIDALEASFATHKPLPRGSRPVTTTRGTVVLSARELAMCAEMKIDPKDYAAMKLSKKGGAR